MYAARPFRKCYLPLIVVPSYPTPASARKENGIFYTVSRPPSPETPFASNAAHYIKSARAFEAPYTIAMSAFKFPIIRPHS